MLPEGWADLPAGWRKRWDDDAYWRRWHKKRAAEIGCVYDEAAADARVKFFSLLRLVKGKWGGQPFVLLPHAEHQIVRPFFGYKEPGTQAPPQRRDLDPKGKRRFRRLDHWVAKKNVKTTTGAGLAAEALILEREPGVEVYPCAADREQAGLVYQTLAPMIAEQPTLAALTKPIESVKRITVPSLNGFLHVNSSEAYTKHGLQPFAVLADELHAWPNRELWDVMTQGAFASRDEWILYVMSTAGFSMTGIGYEEFTYACRVRDGVIDDPRLLPVIWNLTQDDDWKDEANWYRANPALGFPGCGWPYVLDIEDMRAEFRKAIELPTNEQAFRVLRLNTFLNSTTKWVRPEQWTVCETPPLPLTGRVHFGGLDMSDTTDLTAYVRCAWDGQYLDVWGHYFVPAEGIELKEKRDRVPYREWARQGYITLIPGHFVDREPVRAYVNACADADGRPNRIGYDPWNARDLCEKDLPADGHEMVVVRQGPQTLSSPTKHLTELVVGGKARFGDDPVLRWMADNVSVVVADKNGNVQFDKADGKARRRIDGLSALVNALDQAERVAPQGPSVYEERGLLMF